MLTGRLVRHILSMTMVVVLLLTGTSLPPSPFSHSELNEANNNYKEGGSQEIQPESGVPLAEEDYGFIEPVPVLYPGVGAPIPHK